MLYEILWSGDCLSVCGHTGCMFCLYGSCFAGNGTTLSYISPLDCETGKKGFRSWSARLALVVQMLFSPSNWFLSANLNLPFLEYHYWFIHPLSYRMHTTSCAWQNGVGVCVFLLKFGRGTCIQRDAPFCSRPLPLPHRQHGHRHTPSHTETLDFHSECQPEAVADKGWGIILPTDRQSNP